MNRSFKYVKGMPQMVACGLLVVGLHISHAQVVNNYQYDENGRLIADLSEGIAKIEWNEFDKVTKITRVDTSHAADVEFFYNAFGLREAKIVKPRSGNGPLPEVTWVYTYYVSDAAGNRIAVYTRNYQQNISDATRFTEQITIDEQNIMAGNTRIGYKIPSADPLVSRTFLANLDANKRFTDIQETDEVLIPASIDSFSNLRGDKFLEISNHLGSVLVTVANRKTLDSNNQNPSGSYRAAVNTATDYYPFGMEAPGRSLNNGSYRYGFHKKEKDDELKGKGNSYDFAARIYDPRLGRWLSQDPLAKEYPSMSPYSYAMDNPIQFIDPDGREVVDANGNRVGVSVVPTKKGWDAQFKFKDPTNKKDKEKFLQEKRRFLQQEGKVIRSIANISSETRADIVKLNNSNIKVRIALINGERNNEKNIPGGAINAQYLVGAYRTEFQNHELSSSIIFLNERELKSVLKDKNKRWGLRDGATEEEQKQRQSLGYDANRALVTAAMIHTIVNNNLVLKHLNFGTYKEIQAHDFLLYYINENIVAEETLSIYHMYLKEQIKRHQ